MWAGGVCFWCVRGDAGGERWEVAGRRWEGEGFGTRDGTAALSIPGAECQRDRGRIHEHNAKYNHLVQRLSLP